jgi:hypothetical protein
MLIFTTHFDPCLLTTAFAYLHVADSTNNGHRCISLQPLEIFYEPCRVLLLVLLWLLWLLWLTWLTWLRVTDVAAVAPVAAAALRAVAADCRHPPPPPPFRIIKSPKSIHQSTYRYEPSHLIPRRTPHRNGLFYPKVIFAIAYCTYPGFPNYSLLTISMSSYTSSLHSH